MFAFNRSWLVENGFIRFEWQDSIVLCATGLLNNILLCLSLLTWFRLFTKYRKIKWRLWFVEAWVFLLLTIIMLCLAIASPGAVFVWWIALYVLVDAVSAAIRDIVASLHRVDAHGGYIKISNGVRWLLMAAINVIQVVLCFAVFSIHYGDSFEPQIHDAVTAIYFSAVTFLTLGYGDIKPICTTTKWLVIFECLTFLLFLVVKLPVAVSVIRVKERN
jgi:hypothetical protein